MRSGLLSQVSVFANRTRHTGWIVAAVLSGSLNAMAQETTPQSAQAQQPRRVENAKVQIYSRHGNDYESAPPFVDAPNQAGASAQKLEPYQRTDKPAVKNYHAELFGTTPDAIQSVPAANIQQATMLQMEPASAVQPAIQLDSQATTAPTAAPAQGVVPAGHETQAVPSTAATVENAAYEAKPGESVGKIITTGGTEVKEAANELPEWARSMKSRNLFELKPTASAAELPVNPVSEVLPVSATQPQLTIPGSQAVPANSVVEIPADSIAAGPQTPSVKIEWRNLSEINLRQECECELLVSNAGKSAAYGVVVEAELPANVELLATQPSHQLAGNKLSWELGTLAADQVQSIRVRLIPTQRGELAAKAQVRFTGATQSSFVVREPLINLNMEGPAQVLVGDPASQNVTISNPGNGIAKNVRLEAVLPKGLEHARGERLLLDVGSLNPGESRTIRLALAAVGGGNQIVQVAATADGGLTQSAETTIDVIAPSLKAEITGPGLRYKGRTATYTIGVTNDGTVGTSNVRLMHKVPEGFRFVSASRGATYDAPTRILSWFVGKLASEQAAEMQVELEAEKIGDFVHYIRATSEHGSSVDSQLQTRVEGASALVVEITDLDDPVEVGSETAYEVKIVNNGSAAASDVGLTCELPEGVRFVKAEGASQHVADGNVVLFQPLPSIEAGKSVTYRVFVVGGVEGNLRFRARMTSAASQEPLTFEELTRFYGDQR